MKFFLTAWTMMAASLFLAASDNVVFSDVAVSVKMQSSPVVEFKSKNTAFGENPPAVNREWAVIAVTFRPGVGKAGRPAKALRGSWIDEPVLDVAVEVPYEVSTKSKVKSILLTGQTKFWSIPLDGKDHTAVMFVPPRLLDRYIALRGRGDVKASEAMFRIQAVFHAPDGSVLGSGYFNIDGKSSVQEAYFARLAGADAIKDAVLARNKSPWALLNFDHYDLLKE